MEPNLNANQITHSGAYACRSTTSTEVACRWGKHRADRPAPRPRQFQVLAVEKDVVSNLLEWNPDSLRDPANRIAFHHKVKDGRPRHR